MTVTIEAPVAVPMPAAGIALPQRQPLPDDWPQRGSCATDPNPDRWIDLPPVRVRGRVNPAYGEAKRELGKMCATCPIQSTCVWEALTHDVTGIWGGSDEYDRYELRQALDLPEPQPMVFGFGTTVATERTPQDEQRFTARYLAAKTELTYAAIAKRMGLSPMAVTRLLVDRAPEDVPRRERRTA